jgi:hypothetical protein
VQNILNAGMQSLTDGADLEKSVELHARQFDADALAWANESVQ